MCLKVAIGTDSGGEPERALTKDEMLDDISVYWFTKHRDLFRAALLGELRQQLQRRGHLHPCCRDGLSRRDLACATKLGRA